MLNNDTIVFNSSFQTLFRYWGLHIINPSVQVFNVNPDSKISVFEKISLTDIKLEVS